MSLFDLTGRVALVTGGNGGIGLGMAQGLAQAGATVVIAARNREKSLAAVVELKALGGIADFIALDVAVAESCRAAVAETVARHARLQAVLPA